MIRNFIRPAVVICVLWSLGCGEQPTEQSSLRQVTELNGLRLELSLDRSTIPVGDSGSVTIRLRNETARAVRLEFGSTCQILPFIETAAGAIQYPGGGAWGCGAMLTSLEVPGNGVVTRTLVVRGVAGSEGTSPVSLPPGGYRAYALLGATAPGVELRSPTVAFEVR